MSRRWRCCGCGPACEAVVTPLHEAGATPTRITQIFYGACCGHRDFEGLASNMIGVLEGAPAASSSTDGWRRRPTAPGSRRLGRGWMGRPDAALWYCMYYAEGVR